MALTNFVVNPMDKQKGKNSTVLVGFDLVRNVDPLLGLLLEN